MMYMILFGIVTDIGIVVFMAIVTFFAYGLSEITYEATESAPMVKKIRSSKKIKLPQLRLLFKQLESMNLNPKLVLTFFPSRLKIDVELIKSKGSRV